MPSEKSKYLNRRSRPPFYYDEVRKYLPEFSRENLEDIILNFSPRNDALHRTMIISTAIIKFNHTKDYEMLESALIYIFSLQDHVPYNQAGQYSNVIDPVLNFFKEAKGDIRLKEVLKNILPLLEVSSWLLQDENSWYDANEELLKILDCNLDIDEVENEKI
ncbi:MAG: hypothetical protein HQK50_17070 [Oligoflexia bacterium]|nr:hypothetical protein [Oligoflexia bacterium]MBF0367292.1 hypothetical protein [Oligoflexia bacterium]